MSYVIYSPNGVSISNPVPSITHTSGSPYYVTPDDNLICIDAKNVDFFSVDLDTSSSFFTDGKTITVKDFTGYANVHPIRFTGSIDSSSIYQISSSYNSLTIFYYQPSGSWFTI